MMPTDTEENWAAVAGRLRSVPGALDGYRASSAEGIRRGLLCAPRQARAVIAQLDAWTGRNGGASWFTGFTAAGPARLRPELDTAAERATAAAAAFRDWLCDGYLPAAGGTPDAVGRERYLRSARWANGADIDPAEAYAWAWEEFHRTVDEMAAEADRVLPGAGARATMDHLNTDGHAIEGEENIRAVQDTPQVRRVRGCGPGTRARATTPGVSASARAGRRSRSAARRSPARCGYAPAGAAGTRRCGRR
ncbi:DUF885 family protein [Kitasatospora sp. NPDC001159]